MSHRRLFAEASGLLTIAGALLLLTMGRAQGPRAADAAPAAGNVVQVEVVAGAVEVRQAGDTAWKPLRAGTSLGRGDTVRTGANAKAKVVHAGGVIWLFDRTVLRLSTDTDGEVPWLSRPELLRGQALFDVDWSRVGAQAARVGSRLRRAFEVVTPHIVAGVKGTRFVVIEHDDDSYVCVLTGSVVTASRTDSGGPPVVLGPWRVVDYEAGRLKAAQSLAKAEEWAHWIREHAGPFTHDTIVREGWLPAPPR